MALWNRGPIPPKKPKIRNTQQRQYYRSQNKACEICLLGGKYVTQNLDLHHIIPGTGRTDEVWNEIMLCRNCHVQCTEHIYGEQARRKNFICFAIKALKNELNHNKILELGLEKEIYKTIELIKPFFDRIARF